MGIFQMVKYHRLRYPLSIPLHLEEIAGHFDIRAIQPDMPYSLHTEYSFKKRGFCNRHLLQYPEITRSHQAGIPQLWKNARWASEFAEFITDLTGGKAPDTIEIHPPFEDYTPHIQAFIERYRVFEDAIKTVFPKTQLQIENRCGSQYKSGRFRISTVSEIRDLCEQIEKSGLRLRIALDIPQLYTAHGVSSNRNKGVTNLLDELKDIRFYIGGVHIWGKGLVNGRRQAHCGDLNTYFYGDTSLKREFLGALRALFGDNQVRHLVLEVNSGNEDLLSILRDLDTAGFLYI